MSDVAAVIWSLGQRWRDLGPELGRTGAATVVTRNGSARLLDHDVGRTCRLPLEGGHRMLGDGSWQPLWPLAVATPCGLGQSGDLGWWSTSVLIAFEGLVPRWLLHPRGPEVFDRVLAGRTGSAVACVPGGHPPEPCGAMYCPRRYSDRRGGER